MTDHAPVDLVISAITSTEKSKGWRMNTSLLQDEAFCMKLKNQIIQYFETNNGTAKQAFVWDGFKAFIRGIWIQQTSQIKKQDQNKILTCEAEIKKMEKEYWENPNAACLAKLVKTKYELNTIFSKKIDYSF